MQLDDVIYWFKKRTSMNETDQDYDDRALECGLIRCLSDYRRKELENISLSEDFQARFLADLERVDQEVYEETFGDRLSNMINSRGVRYSFAIASMALVTSFLVLNLRGSYEIQKQDLSHIPLQSTLDPAMFSEIDEELQLINEIRRNPDDIVCLKRLEEYYLTHGNVERATRIHYTLETLPK